MTVKRTTYLVIALCFAFILAVGFGLEKKYVQAVHDDMIMDIARNKTKAVEVHFLGLFNAMRKLAAGLSQDDAFAAFTPGDADDAEKSGSFMPGWRTKRFFVNNSLACLVYAPLSGSPLFVRYYDSRLDGFVDAPAPLLDALRDGLPYPSQGAQCKQSLVMLGDIPLLLIGYCLPDGEEPQGGGYLVLGQILDQKVTHQARKTLGMHIVGIPRSAAGFPPALKSAVMSPSADGMDILRYETGMGSRIALGLYDNSRNLAYLLQVEPAVEKLGEVIVAGRQYRYYCLALLLGGMLFLLLYMAIAVFSPLTRITGLMGKLLRHEYDPTQAPSSLGFFKDVGDGVVGLADRMGAMEREKNLAESRLRYREKMGETLSAITKILFRESLDGVLKSLRVLARNFNADFAYFWEASSDRQTMHCLGAFRDPITGEYTGEYDFTAPMTKWVNDAIRHNAHIIIQDIGDVDDDLRAIKTFLEEFEVKSFFAAPLNSASGRVGGVLAIGAIQSIRKWTEEDVKGLESVAEMFSFMLEKR